MKKKYYTIFFASDKNQYSRSIKVSNIGIIFLMFFGIVLICLSVFGSSHLVNQKLLNSEIKEYKRDRLLLNNIISDLNNIIDLDSNVIYENFVSQFYSVHNLGYPKVAPVDGYVTRGLQLENNHLGIDIATKFKDAVYAPDDGRVIYAGSKSSNILGETIIITHPNGFITVFGHNDSLLVQSGEKVKKNQIISYVGETGDSHGPHLHYEIWKNNQILDPREIVPIYKKKDVSIGEGRK